MTSLPDHTLIIETQPALTAFCQQIQTAEYLAIDTEFVRDKTYYPKLCLLQIASDKDIACIDPLKVKDLSPLKAIFTNPAQTKIFHAARQDLELLLQELGLIPTPIFDTQIAATLLGLGEQIGYANLVKHYLQINLSKQHTRADWEKRPLSDEQLDYAADDVRYLIQMFPLIMAELEKYGRRNWLQNDFKILSDPTLYQINPTELWQKISGNQKLRPKQLAVLQQLCIWREQLAMDKNRPRKWILADNITLAIAIAIPNSISKLANTRGISQATIDKYGNDILNCITTALNTPEDQWPSTNKKHKLNKNQEAAVDALLAIVKLKAIEHNISAGAIVNRNELEKLVLGQAKLDILQGWRFNLVGETLVNFLNNKVSLNYRDNSLQIITNGS